ncbi:MAG: DUF2480 family protein [Bacteroidetes bacterium]|nr:DUF2480 family protein [Bacteroidota bacterium]MDA0903564.1 DUF2480 family protein [Bacteroidota bacterium]MDA1242129.1 DUF2480 family protein [Bacteroidota bacterium]
MDEPILNRVDAAGLMQVDLAKILKPSDVVVVDLAPWLADGWVLREKDFRAAIAAWDIASCEDCVVALCCSTDAILPDWSWMLVAARLESVARDVLVGNESAARARAWQLAVKDLDVADFKDKRVLVKGCASVGGADTLVTFTRHIQGTVKSLMFGEACSSVPLVKNR